LACVATFFLPRNSKESPELLHTRRVHHRCGFATTSVGNNSKTARIDQRVKLALSKPSLAIIAISSSHIHSAPPSSTFVDFSTFSYFSYGAFRNIVPRAAAARVESSDFRHSWPRQRTSKACDPPKSFQGSQEPGAVILHPITQPVHPPDEDKYDYHCKTVHYVCRIPKHPLQPEE
jgi:hypothetical protein